MLGALSLASRANRRTGANLSVDGQLGLGIPAGNNGRYAEWPYTRVERVCLNVASHAVGERRGRNGGLVELPPLRRLVTGSGDEVATVGEETRRHDAHVAVNGRYALVGTRLDQLAADELLESEHNTILAPDAQSCAAVLYRLDCILDLEVATVGREDRVGKVVACAY